MDSKEATPSEDAENTEKEAVRKPSLFFLEKIKFFVNKLINLLYLDIILGCNFGTTRRMEKIHKMENRNEKEKFKCWRQQARRRRFAKIGF